MDSAKLFLSSFGGAPGPEPDPGDPIQNSVRFAAGQVLTVSQQAPKINGDVCCCSMWIKPTKGDVGENSIFVVGDASPEDFIVSLWQERFQWRGTSGYSFYREEQYIRDESAWMHIYWEKDTSQVTTLWVNGVRCPNQGQMISTDRSFNIGSESNENTSAWYDGYIAQVYFIQGDRLGWDTFARYNAHDVIVPVAPQGLTFGTNGFHLEFQQTDLADLGYDSSPNGNHLTPKGFDGDASGYSTDTPTNNSAVGNTQPENNDWTAANLRIDTPNGYIDGAQTSFGIRPGTGKYYWEVRAIITTGNFAFGMTRGINDAHWDTNGWYWSPPLNQLAWEGGQSLSGYAADPTWATNFVYGMAYDSDTQELWIARNGVWLAVNLEQPGDPENGLRPFVSTANAFEEGVTYYPGSFGSGGGATGFEYYFDPEMWQETCPAGFNPITSTYVPTGDILNGRDHFQAITAPGQGVDGNPPAGQIAGGFSQDLTVSGYYQDNSTLYSKTNAFNGSTTGTGFTSEPDGNWAFAPSTPIPVTSSVTVYQSNNAGTTSWNGENLQPNGTSITFNSAGEISQASPLTSTTAGSSGQSCFLLGIEVDGELLVDYGILPLAQQTFPTGLWWVKDRIASGNHQLVDSVRGNDMALTTPTKGGQQQYSFPGNPSAAWCWDASDPRKSGFNILTWTGNGTKRELPTGLLGNTDCVLIKAYGGTDTSSYLPDANWIWWNKGMPDDQFFYFNSTFAIVTGSTGFFDGNPAQGGSGTLTVNTDPDVNASSAYGALEYVGYCWTEVPGFSKFGTFEGNSNSDGPYINCGFKPAYVMLRSYEAGDGHHMVDSTRAMFNPITEPYQFNAALEVPEGQLSGRPIDFYSNGFKLRTGSGDVNQSTVAYAAWAENPFQIPATAR